MCARVCACVWRACAREACVGGWVCCGCVLCCVVLCCVVLCCAVLCCAVLCCVVLCCVVLCCVVSCCVVLCCVLCPASDFWVHRFIVWHMFNLATLYVEERGADQSQTRDVGVCVLQGAPAMALVFLLVHLRPTKKRGTPAKMLPKKNPWGPLAA